MKIESQFVTFDQSVLLRKNGFDQETFAFYWRDTKQLIVDNEKGRHHGCHIQAPEQWQVIEWFRIKYNIWIKVGPQECYTEFSIAWMYLIMSINKNKVDFICRDTGFNTPQEAYSEAINHVLNNLIQ